MENYTMNLMCTYFDSLDPEDTTSNTSNLYRHQKVAIDNMIQIEKTHKIYNGYHKISTNIGIYADKGGSGKTRTIISLILSNENPSNAIPVTLGGNYMMHLSRVEQTSSRVEPKSTLIIVSHDSIKFWKEEFKNMSHEDVFICNKTKYIEDLQANETFPKIVLMSNTMYQQFPHDFKWSRTVIDEPQSFSLHRMPDCNFTWLITSNPFEVIYPRRNYLKKIIPYMFNPHHANIFENIVIKNYDVFVDESINIPSFVQVDIPCKTNEYIRNIRKNVPIQALQKINDGATRDALDMLECSVGTEKYIVDKIVNKLSETEGINTRKRLMEPDCCPICLDTPEDLKAITHCCNNVFCVKCLLKASYTTEDQRCPMCKRKNCDKKLHIITNNDELQTHKKKKHKTEKPLNKTQTLLYHIQDMVVSDRIILWVDDYSLSHIVNSMNKLGFNYETLIGRQYQQKCTIERFKKGDTNILIMTENYMGGSCDLSFATELIFYDTTSARDKIIGRAQRIGRKNPLKIINLIYDDERAPLVVSVQPQPDQPQPQPQPAPPAPPASASASASSYWTFQ